MELKELTEEELFTEAKKRYPIGCKIDQRTAYDGLEQELIINSHDVCKLYSTSFSIGGVGVYDTKIKKWAEIVEQSKQKEMTIEEIQAECKKRFPIGCKFRCASTDNKNTLEQTSSTYNILGIDAIDAGILKGFLYYEGKYAELIEAPEVISPEYVECIKGHGKHFHTKVGIIYKVKSYDKDSERLEVEGYSGFILHINFVNSKVKDNCVDYKISSKEAFEEQERGSRLVYSSPILSVRDYTSKKRNNININLKKNPPIKNKKKIKTKKILLKL